MTKPIIIGITGASGTPIAVDAIKTLHRAGVAVHLVVSWGGALTLRHECGMEVEALSPFCDAIHDPADIGACIASGSFSTAGMLIAPCSMKTLAGIHSGYSDNLLLRAADVTLKERRRLVLMTRECPLSTIHLRNMLELSQMGAIIVPPMLSYYQHPQSVRELTRHMTGKLLDLFDVPVEGFCHWEGMGC